MHVCTQLSIFPPYLNATQNYEMNQIEREAFYIFRLLLQLARLFRK